MKILITGSAGFIGYHATKRFAHTDGGAHQVYGIDNINDYYDVDLKRGRLAALGFDAADGFTAEGAHSARYPNVRFAKIDICDKTWLDTLCKNERFDAVIHLAAQAGVRYSMSHPDCYVTSNVQGFLNVLEACRPAAGEGSPPLLIYASSSSVYGACAARPWSESADAGHPLSLYAASKRAGELMAHSYSHLYRIPTVGLRFFTVYGPWGRPDMAPFIFTKSILEGKPLNVFNNGNMERDFTFIDDIVEGIARLLDRLKNGGAFACGSENGVPAALFNIGNGAPVALPDFIRTLEDSLGKKAVINYTDMQPGDVPSTWADCSVLERFTGFKPRTPLAVGVQKFVTWYKDFYYGGAC